MEAPTEDHVAIAETNNAMWCFDCETSCYPNNPNKLCFCCEDREKRDMNLDGNHK